MPRARRRAADAGPSAPDVEPDPERIAALVDSRLRGRERAEALARLAASEDGVEVLAETTAVQEQRHLPRGAHPVFRPTRYLDGYFGSGG